MYYDQLLKSKIPYVPKPRVLEKIILNITNFSRKGIN